jgi:chromosome segregation ATPase
MTPHHLAHLLFFTEPTGNLAIYLAAASLLFSLACSLVATTMYITLTRERVQRLQEHEKRIDAKIDNALVEFRVATSTLRALATQQEHLDDHETELRADLRSATAEIQSLIVTVRSASSEQNVLNRVTSELLAGLTRRCEQLESRLNDTAGSVSLLAEVLKQKAIIE